jgi:hypothetical protein
MQLPFNKFVFALAPMLMLAAHIALAQGSGVPGGGMPGVSGPRLTQPGAMQPRLGGGSIAGQRQNGVGTGVGSRAAQNVVAPARNMNMNNMSRMSNGQNMLRSSQQFRQQTIMGATRGMNPGRPR